MKRVTVDCNESEWAKQVHSRLYAGCEVDLVNFEYDLHGDQCEWLARVFQAEKVFEVEFLPDRDPAARAAHFRLKSV